MKKTVLILLAVTAMVLGLAAGAGAGVCSTTKVQCWGKSPASGLYNVKAGEVTAEACYNAAEMSCPPCNGICSFKDLCNTTFPADCHGACHTYWHSKHTGHWMRCGHIDGQPQ